MTTYKNGGIAGAGGAVIIGLLIGLVAGQLFGTAPKQVDAVQSFDHSNCQYPDRWTNPADGCDNSDPAVPECIKASYSQESEKACIDAFVLKNAQPAQPVEPTVTPAPAKATECGGK